VATTSRCANFAAFCDLDAFDEAVRVIIARGATASLSSERQLPILITRGAAVVLQTNGWLEPVEQQTTMTTNSRILNRFRFEGMPWPRRGRYAPSLLVTALTNTSSQFNA